MTTQALDPASLYVWWSRLGPSGSPTPVDRTRRTSTTGARCRTARWCADPRYFVERETSCVIGPDCTVTAYADRNLIIDIDQEGTR